MRSGSRGGRCRELSTAHRTTGRCFRPTRCRRHTGVRTGRAHGDWPPRRCRLTVDTRASAPSGDALRLRVHGHGRTGKLPGDAGDSDRVGAAAHHRLRERRDPRLRAHGHPPGRDRRSCRARCEPPAHRRAAVCRGARVGRRGGGDRRVSRLGRAAAPRGRVSRHRRRAHAVLDGFPSDSSSTWSVVAFTLLAAGIVGVVPALKATNTQVQTRLQTLAPGSGSRMQMGRLWTLLIVAQVAMTVALLPAAMFFTWDGLRLRTGDAGFASPKFLSASLAMDRRWRRAPPQMMTRFKARLAAAQRELDQRLRAEPQVVDVTFSLTNAGDELAMALEAEGQPPPADPVALQHPGRQPCRPPRALQPRRDRFLRRVRRAGSSRPRFLACRPRHRSRHHQSHARPDRRSARRIRWAAASSTSAEAERLMQTTTISSGRRASRGDSARALV